MHTSQSELNLLNHLHVIIAIQPGVNTIPSVFTLVREIMPMWYNVQTCSFPCYCRVVKLYIHRNIRSSLDSNTCFLGGFLVCFFAINHLLARFA